MAKRLNVILPTERRLAPDFTMWFAFQKTIAPSRRLTASAPWRPGERRVSVPLC